ncbi:M15 family metallopeptidase [Riemerella columbina]|uniref:M15 family metallopeptidase n=1 Tax=Riemerella columbina TaxID=103810 RepID=UPI00037B1816|nr:M15 family metallopeptidase [Riemerella columbina]
MDKITLQRIELLHPKLREEAKAIYKEICEALTGKAICRFTHTLRTFAEQDALYAIGRTKKGSRVTNARGGQSYHNYGLAVDIVLLIDKDNNGTHETAVWDTKGDYDNDRVADWQEIVAIFKRYGWTWGGDWRFKDYPHFQKTFGKSIVELQNLHRIQKKEYVNF